MISEKALRDTKEFGKYYLILIFSLMTIIPYGVLINEVTLSIVFILLGILFSYYIMKKWSSIQIGNLELIITLIISLSVFYSIFRSSDKVLSAVNSVYVFIFLITYVYIRNNLHLEKNIIKAIFIGGSVYSVISIIINLNNPYNRLEGLFNYANGTAIFLAICSVLYFYNYNWLLQEKYGKVFKILNLITISALFATESRGGILIYILALIIGEKKAISHKLDINILGIILAVFIIRNIEILYFLLLPIIVYFIGFVELNKVKFVRKNKKIFEVFKYSIYGLSFVFIVYTYFNRLLEIKLTNSQLQERLVFIFDGINIIKKNIFGIGAGQYNKQQFLYQSASYDTKYVHNGFIQVGIDYGILVLAIFLIYILFLMIKTMKAKMFNQWFVIAAMILLHSVFDFSLSFIVVGSILAISMAFLQGADEITKMESIINLVGKYMYVILFAISFIFIIASIPYEVIYNYAIYKEQYGTRTAYNSLKLLDRYPIKDNRYYIKLGGIEFERYDEIEDKALLANSIENLNKYISLEKNDARALETLSAVYFKLGKLNDGEKALKDIIDIRPYYPTAYSKLMDLYYYNIKEAVNKRDIKTIKQNLISVDYISNKLSTSMKSRNTKAEYMENQLTSTIDIDHEQVFMDIENIKGKYNNLDK